MSLRNPNERRSSPLRLALLAALAAIVHGLVVVAMFPPWRLWMLAPVAIVPLVLVARVIAGTGDATPRAWTRWLAYGTLWLASLPSWLWIERWIRDVSEAGWPALSLLMAFWPALFTGLLARIMRRRSFPLDGRSDGAEALMLPLTAAVLFTGIECFRAHVFFDGYPWYLLAHPLIDAPWLAQSAELWSVAPLTFLCAWTGSLLVTRLVRWRRAWIVTASVWGLLAVGGAVRVHTLPMESGPVFLAVQTNVPSSNKVRWTFEQQLEDFAKFRDLTLDGVLDARARGLEPALVAWPETMLPGLGLEPDTIALQRALRVAPADVFANAIDRMIEATGVPMLLGSNAFEGLRDEGQNWRWDRRFNSVYLVVGEPPHRRYDKMRLTPFGETMPYIRASPRLQQALLDLGASGLTFDLDEGSEEVVFELAGGFRFVSPICFEATMPWHCRRLVYSSSAGKGADLIVNLSNDGWFGGDDDGRATHELTARWRAIENRVGVLRVVNTGITSLIDPTGRVIERLPPRTPGWLVAPTMSSRVVTLFGRVGDVGSWLFMITTMLLAVGSFMPRTARLRGRAAPLLATTLIVVAGLHQAGCSGPPPKLSSRPPQASPSALGSSLGLDAPTSQQSWSTREKSVMLDQVRGSSGDSLSRTVPPGLPVVSSGDVKSTARELLQTAARSGFPILEANAIEALESDPEGLREIVRPALVNPNRGVRFVAAMTIGKAKLEDMGTLLQPLLLDPSESVRAAAIFALVRIGHPVDVTPLATMIRSEDPEVRGNAVMVLGELGNPSAIPVLRSTIGLGMSRVDPARRRITDLQLAEALAKLGEDAELEPIRAALFAPSQQAEIIALACQIIGRMKDGGSISSLQAVAYAEGSAMRPPEIRLLAFIALSDLGAGDPAICGEFARRYLSDRNPQLRSLAVRAVAGCETGAALPAIESKLYDQNPEVQIAAAGAILRLAKGGHIR